MYWNHDDFWNKAVTYMERAFEQETRDSELFPFWATIGLEFLGRAVLAKVHPSLLADPQDQENVMYAWGLATPKLPKSVPAKTVFERLKLVVSGFTQKEAGFAMSLMNKRNEELHTGLFAFEGFKSAEWVPDFYAVCKLLTEHLGHTLDELLGIKEAKIAKETLEATDKEVLGAVKKRVAAYLAIYDGFDSEKKKQKQEESVSLLVSKHPNLKIKCPSCGNRAILFGKVVKTSEPKTKGDIVFWEDVHLATSFQCHVCGLYLNGIKELRAADIELEYSVLSEIPVWDYYTDNTDAEYEGEYNNS